MNNGSNDAGSAVLRLNSWAAYASILFAYTAFAVAFNPIGMPGTDSNWRSAAMGVLLMQPILLAVWAAIGPQSTPARVALVLAALVFLVFVGSFKQWNLLASQPGVLVNSGTTDRPILEAEDAAAPLGLFAIAGVIAFVAGRSTRRRISRLPAEQQNTSGQHQFSVRYLLGIVTACAVLLALAHNITFNARPHVSAIEFVFPLLFTPFLMAFLLPALVLSAIVLSQKPFNRRHTMNLVAACIASLLIMVVMCLMDSRWVSTLLGLLLSMLGGRSPAAY
jgi:hypothetical protein